MTVHLSLFNHRLRFQSELGTMNESSFSVIDKSVRSVFVGNIPYEATEEKLKDIFAEVGPVVSFKLVFDRETGKPMG